jgi:translation elongation factor EF-Tu-like GTPase
MTAVFQMPVQSMFHMPGQGTIFHGRIVLGRISMGSRIVVASPNRFVSAKVAGIEGRLRFPFPLRGVVMKLPFLFGISI